MKLKLTEIGHSGQIPLQSLVDVNRGLASIIRHSYRSLAGASPRSRSPEMKLFATKFQNGSYISDLVVQIAQQTDNRQMMFAFAHISPDDVFKVAKGAIWFWKTLREYMASGKTVNININAEPGSIVFANTGNGTITTSNSIIQAAAAIPKAGELMAKPLRRGELEVIEMAVEKDPPLLLLSADADCFRTPIEVDTQVKQVIGDLVEFDKKKLTGTFEYIEGQDQVKRTFSLAAGSAIIPAIESMKGRCRMFFHEEYIELPGDRRAVVRLQTIKVEPVK